jgi:Fe-S-cluster containining protein
MTIKDSLKNFKINMLKDEITSMQNPECVDCNECCSMGTMLTNDEYTKLKRFIKKDRYGKYLYQQGVGTILRYFKQGIIYWMCPFSLNKRCQIYKSRPAICKQFHCDESAKSKEFRDSYDPKSHTILELFKDDTFDTFGKKK